MGTGLLPWQWAAAAGTAAVVVALAAAARSLRRRGVHVLGPVFRYELVMLARRGQQPRLRALLVGLLLAGLLATYLWELEARERVALLVAGGVELDLHRTARFGRAFLTAFLTAQLVAVVLITPAVVGGALTEEKERGTLDYLRASLLSDREIVVGKLAARLAFVGGVVLAGLPVLALTALFGGVDAGVLLAGYAVAGTAAAGLGAYSLYLGTARDSLRDVLTGVYGAAAGLTAVGLCGCCVPGVGGLSPATTLLYMFVGRASAPGEPEFWVNVGTFVGIYGVLTVVWAALAVGRVRGDPPVRRRGPQGRPARPPAADPDVTPHRPVASRLFRVPRLRDGDPLLWKERYFSGQLGPADGLFGGCGTAALTLALFGLGMVLFFTSLDELNRGRWTGQAVNLPARLFLTGGAGLLGLGLAVRAAGAVARERQKGTLDGLLTLPGDRADVLRAKWVAQLAWGRRGLVALAGAAGFALIVGGVHPAGLAVGAAQLAGWLVFAPTLGVWLSVRCRTAARATAFAAGGCLAVWGGPLLLVPVAPVAVEVAAGPGGDPAVAEGVAAGLSLPVGAWQALFPWAAAGRVLAAPEGRPWRAGLVGGCLAAALYVGAAAALWWAAGREFEREGK